MQSTMAVIFMLQHWIYLWWTYRENSHDFNSQSRIRIKYDHMMRLAETDLTDTSMCHPGLLPDPFSNRKTLTAMESELITFLASWTPLS